MQQNILKASNVTKIFLKFTDGKKYNRKEAVKLRYMDNRSCYFAGQAIINFSKPKWRAKTEIIVYTPDGVYSTIVTIKETSYSLNNILYKVDIPKSWKFTQLRAGTRKEIALPINVKFNDGLEISGETYDLSTGGFSIISNQELSTIHTRFACICKIQFPKDAIINFPDGILETEALYVRQKPIKEGFDLEEYKMLCFKFKNLSADDTMILKNFLIKQE